MPRYILMLHDLSNIVCMCNMQYCDGAIQKYFPELSNKAKGTFVNAVVITSGSVALINQKGQLGW